MMSNVRADVARVGIRAPWTVFKSKATARNSDIVAIANMVPVTQNMNIFDLNGNSPRRLYSRELLRGVKTEYIARTGEWPMTQLSIRNKFLLGCQSSFMPPSIRSVP